ncbi:conserved hypothetical protein [Leishmania braziliensis MHOM/BR/75/M2904]|uniref:Uncharacterized protein n=2 Tax=Leishmania braziliensis TaxID=5660 RepID=A4HP11_LEIBR|nr:conserved hypothetical protein [Leishmania braziliensis MHOM/BR/75/M2904]KAI5691224.1 hypothetical protein MNV84_07928 [Leishmania braziliensis]CAJ2481313.1 unnamed protein product [Leishmania braziliensis]CAM43917.1 conserved hypothetical protein [Leishmania braziliensis MHOM/BR/75/M2904]SYZ69972.1 hypothetical_protein [Leishmania braziliensis MHOM/BR/75/M2904]
MLSLSISRRSAAPMRCRPCFDVVLGARQTVPPLAAYIRRPFASSRALVAAAVVSADHTVLDVSKRCEHTTTETPSRKQLTTKEQVDELMDSFAEACELLTDAKESVGTTYFADDIEDAENQTQDVLKRWESLQADLEHQGAAEQLQRVRSMYELKIKQLKAEFETVREAGGAG